jgi:methionine-rich copper-binding protein CopC
MKNIRKRYFIVIIALTIVMCIVPILTNSVHATTYNATQIFDSAYMYQFDDSSFYYIFGQETMDGSTHYRVGNEQSTMAIYNAALKFNMPAPDTSNIRYAKLKLHIQSINGSTGVNIYGTANDVWNTLSGEQFPLKDNDLVVDKINSPVVTSLIVPLEPGNYKTFDVTSIVKNNADSILSLILMSDRAYSDIMDSSFTFNSMEDANASFRPSLEIIEYSAPTVVTESPASAIGLSTATINCNISDDGGKVITARGVQYRENILGSSFIDAPAALGASTYSVVLSGLESETEYVARAYATNEKGTSYGQEVTFSTLAPTATISVSEPLAERNLDTNYIDIALNGTSFVDSTLLTNNFSLNNPPAGLSIEGVDYVDSSNCRVQLAFNDVDFDSDISNLSVSIGGSELVKGTSMTSSNSLAITAYSEAKITSVGVPAALTYKPGDTLLFTVNFDKNVNITGIPNITLNLDTGKTININYSGGSGTNALTFNYTVLSGQENANIIGAGTNIDLNAGTIKDLSAVNAELTIAGMGSTSGIKLDGIIPQISILNPANASVDVEAASNLSITFDENVASGTGNITIKNSANEIVEVIDVTAGRVSVSGNTVSIDPIITLSEETVYYLLIDSSAIKDVAGNNFSGIAGSDIWRFTTKETTPPSIISKNPFDDAVNVNVSDNLSIVFSESVAKGIGDVLLKKASDNSTVDAQITGWGSNTLTINPNSNLIELADYYVLIDNNAIMDAKGNYFAGISENTIWNFRTADTTVPIVNSVSITDGTYKIGQEMIFSCLFSEDIVVNNGGSLKLNIDGVYKYAAYDSLKSPKELQYKYTVEQGISDVNGIVVTALEGADITDIAGNIANVSVEGKANTSGVLVDGIAPAVDDNNPDSVYLPIINKLTVKIKEKQGLGNGLGSSAVDISKFTVKDGLNSRTLSIGQSTIEITDSSTITINIGGTDLSAVEAFTDGERITAVSVAAGGIVDSIGNSSMEDNDNTVITQEVMTIVEDTPMTEENLDARYIEATLSGTKFIDNVLEVNNFVLNNKPANLQIQNVEYISPTQCKIHLQYDGRDFDTSITKLAVTINASELTNNKIMISQNMLGIAATSDIESLVLSGNINEGAEDTGVITVKINGGTFNTITSINWTVENLPQGVTVKEINKVDKNNLTISLMGNATRDYDTDITNIRVVCKSSEFSEPDSGITELTANTGVVFRAVNDAEAMAISAIGTIKEREESGKIINVIITGGTFVSNNKSNWTVNNLPVGVTIGAIDITSPTTVSITLQGNATEDYDVDRNITVSCDENAYSDSEAKALTSSNNLVLIGKLDPVVLTDTNLENLGPTSVTVKGNVTSDGKDNVLERGIEYKKGIDTLYTIKAASAAGTGEYSVNITGLQPFTAYDVRAYVKTLEGITYGAVVPVTTLKTNNANLSALTLSSGSIVFSPSTISYDVSVANNVTSITVNPTTSESTATIKVNGVDVSSGVNSQPISLSVGSNDIRIVVTADNGATTKTYTLKVIRATATSSGGSSGGYSGGAAPAPNTDLTDVIVNGISNSIATIKTKQENGVLVTTVNVDNSRLGAYLNSLASQHPKVVIPVNTNANTLVCQFNGTIISTMAQQDATLEIRTSDISYSVPLAGVDLQGAIEQLGSGAKLSNVNIDIQIAQSNKDTMKIIEDTANKNNHLILVKPVEFKITVSWGSKIVELNGFKSFLERTIAIPEGVNPKKITTGVVLNNDGTFSHVPTIVIEVGGKYYAKINSLTNSTYTVIQNIISYKDMEGHWAKDVVNDLGSRLILSNVNKDIFGPNEEITRAEFASNIVEALGLMRPHTGKEVFKDVRSNDWYFDAVSIAYERGIVKGDNGVFKPEDKITRAEAMLILSRAMEIAKLDINMSEDKQNKLLAKYSDKGQVAYWAKSSVAACLNSGIVVGIDKKILPNKNITRAETAIMIRRILKEARLI